MKIVNQNEFQAITSKGVVLVDFFATWCGPCKMLAPVLEELSEKYGDKINVVKVDVDQSGDLAQAYRIMAVPTMIVFKDGKVVDQMAGYMPLEEIEATINQYIG